MASPVVLTPPAAAAAGQHEEEPSPLLPEAPVSTTVRTRAHVATEVLAAQVLFTAIGMAIASAMLITRTGPQEQWVTLLMAMVATWVPSPRAGGGGGSSNTRP